MKTSNMILLLAVAVILTACVPAVSQYSYISLENFKEIKIEEKSKLSAEGLLFGSQIPVKYSLERENYTIIFSISKVSLLPHINATAISKLDNSLEVKPRIDWSHRAPIGLPCLHLISSTENKEVVFVWAKSCSEDSEKNLISFDVVEQTGKVIGHEVVPFEIKSAGIYYYIDSI